MGKKLMLRCIALLLVLVTLGMLVVSCGGDDPAEDPKNPGSNNTDPNPPAGEVEFKDKVPAMDMDGYTFTALARTTDWFADEVTAEDGTGDLILQEIYDRNDRIQNRFNCIIDHAFIQENEWTTWQTSVTSGANEYKYSLNHMMQTATESLTGTMLNLNELPHLDLYAPWWNQSANSDLNIGGKLYFTSNEFCTSSIYLTWIMIFNMDMVAEREIEPYKLVDSGDWTIDTLYEIVSDSYEDDGDSIVNFNDTYGLISHNNTVMTNYIFSFNIPVVTLDSKGEAIVEYNLPTSKMPTAVEKVYNLFYNSSNGGKCYTDQELQTGTGTTSLHDNCIVAKFATKTALFANTRLHALEDMRTSDVKFGILPFPKYDADQDGYYTHVDGRASLIFVPYTLPESEYEYVGALMEALAAETYDDVLPQIQDSALLSRYSEDSDAYRCLEMTLRGRTFAFAYVFNSAFSKSQPYWAMTRLIQKANGSFVSDWRGKANLAGPEINKVLKKYATANK